MTARRVRHTISLAVLLLASTFASAATTEFRVLFDVDNNPSTGCTVGTMSGVDQVFITQATNDDTTAAVTRTQRLICTGGVLGEPVDVNETGWPAAIDPSTHTMTVETRVPFTAFQASGLPFNMRVGFVATAGSATQSLLSGPLGGVILFPSDSPGRRRAVDFGDPRTFVLDGQMLDWGMIAAMSSRELGLADTGFQFFRAFAHANSPDQFIYFSFQARPGTGTGPTANDDDYVRQQGQALTIPVAKGVLKNDVDPNGAPLTATKVSEPNHGNVTLNPDGSFLYTPTAPASVEVDHFTYIASNGSASSNTAKVTIEVNDKPKVKNDAFTVAENVPNGTVVGVVDVQDEAGDAHTFAILSGNTGGAFAITALPNGDGQLTVANRNAVNFEVNPSFSLTVRATDEGGLSDTGVITVTVTNVNDAPVASNDNRSVAEDQLLTVPAPGLYSFVTDEDGNPLTLSIVTNGAHGVAAINPDGSWSYDSDPNYNGPDSFTWRAFDGTTFSNTATVSINVTPVNDAPSFTISGNPPASNEDAGPQTVSGFATAISQGPLESGQTLTFMLASTGTTGTISFVSGPAIDPVTGNLTYTAGPNTNGTASFNVTLVDDGSNTPPNSNTSGTQAFTITVVAVNDVPTFSMPGTTSSNEDAGPQTVNGFATSISAGPSDESSQTLTFSVTQTSSDPTLSFLAAPAIDASGNLTYTANADAFGSATFDVTLSDNGTPVGTSVVHTLTITVNAVNDAPVLTAGGTLNYTENDAPTAIDTTITIADVDSTNLAGATVQITGNYQNGQDVLSFVNAFGITGSFNAGTGTLTLSGSSSRANYETALRSVRYNNTSEDPSTAARTVTWQVNDGSGSNNLSNTPTSTINVASVNDAPTIVSGNTVAYTENGAPVTLNSAIVINDVDSTNLQGATVMVSGNAQLGSDILACPACGGTITANYNAGSGVLTLSGTDTVANYQTVLRSVTFANSNDNPSTAQRGIDWFVTDTSAATNVDNSSNDTYVNVTAVNDAPVLTAGGTLNFTENNAATAIDTTITITDADSATLTGATVQITTNYQNGEDVLSYVTALGITGSFNAGTGTLTLSGVAPVADYQTALRNVLYNNTSDNPNTSARTVTWQVNDGAGINNLSNTATSTINVAAGNDAPVVNAAATLAYTEGTGAQVIDATLTTSDVDDTQYSSATVQITANYVNGEDVLGFVNAFGITGSFNAGTGTLTLSGTTSIANYQSALRTVTYQNTSSNPSVAPRTITWTAFDIAPLGGSDTTTINITAVNSSPVLTAGGTLNFNENQGATAIDTTITVTDADTANLASATVQITSNYVNGEDVLSYVTALGISGSFNAGTGTLTLTGAATPANWQTALRNVLYNNTSDNPSTAARTVSWQINDGEVIDNLSNTVTSTINVAAVNDPPTVNAVANIGYTEDAGTVVIDGGVTVADLDDTNLTGATVQITGNYQNGQDVLGFVNAFGITGSFNAGSGTLTLSGSASVANYQSALRTVTYTNNSQDPSALMRTVTWTVNDSAPSSGTDTTTITVTSTNDAPVVTPATFNVNENSANGTSVGTVNYTDPDSGQTHTYSITAGNTGGAFAINASTGEITVANVAALNFEATPAFSLTVQVDDNGTPALNGTATITINLNNVNDAPVVNDQSFNVNENVANGTVVGTVLATDEDAGQTLTYSITAGNTGTAFAINPGTGQITVANPINFETTPSYSLTVQVQDNGAGNLTDTATVTITVNNLNENPVVTPATFNVNENSPNGTVVGTVSATDPDAGQTLTYSITAGNTGGAFAINASSGQITVANPINFEATPSYSLTVQAQDNGAGNLTGTATITINVNNVNENPVVTPATFTLDENSANATVVGTVSATDPDAGQTLTYSITAGNTGGAFAINASSGQITVANSSAVNFEVTPTFSLTVQAQDNGAGNLTGTATITINLNNVNDAPVIGNQAFSVAENSPNGTVVGTVAATDEDAGQTLTYAITAGNTGNVFAINSSTGQITVVGALNYEGPDDPYLLTVQVTDNAGSPLSSSATVTITLLDVNEAPVYNDATPPNINENSPNGTVVGTFTATDPDAGQTLTYSITAGNTGNAFAINASTGQITVQTSAQLNYEAVTQFVLTVQATDNGTPILNDTATITINLTNVNEAPTAVVDAYNALGGTTLHIAGTVVVPATNVAKTGDVTTTSPRTSGVKANDTDPDLIPAFNTLTITFVTGNGAPVAVPGTATTVNGRVSMEADGSFIYTPNAGFIGADSFTYTINDALNNATGTVNINVVGPAIRYVKNNAPTAGNGTSLTPHQTLAAAILASTAGEIIYVMEGDGTATNYGGTNVMKLNQKLWGQGVDLDVTSTNGVVFNDLIAATNRPFIGPDGGGLDVIRLGNGITGVEVRGLRINGGTANAVDVTTTAAGAAGLIFNGNIITAAGAEGIDVNAGGSGAHTLDIQGNTITATGNGVDINRTAGTASVVFSNNTVTSSNAGGAAVNIAGGAAASTTITGFSNNTIHQASTGAGITISNATFDPTAGAPFTTVLGGVTSIGVSGDAVGTSGFVMTNVLGDLSFTNLNIFAGNGSGLFASSTGVFNAGSGTGFRLVANSGTDTIAATNGPAVSITSATINLTPNVITTTGSTSQGVNLDTVAGTFTAGSGSSINTSNAAATAYRINASSVASTYNGPITVTAGKGIDLTGNSGAMAFTGTLSLSTGASTAFNATGGGTVSSSDTASTITTTTATAINVVSTNIGAAHLKFRTVSAGTGASGPANGIVLNTTGNAGSLIISGTGSAGTGGTIQRTTGVGILMTSTENPQFNWMNITLAGDDGIRGSSVNNMTLSNCTLTTNGNAAAENGLQLGEATGSIVGITGTLTMTNTSITASAGNNVHIRNTSGTLNAMNITGGSFNDLNDVTGANSFLFEMSGTATTVAATLSGVTFNNNSPQRALEVQSHDTANISDFVVTGATFTNNGIHASFTQDTSSSIEFSLLNSNLQFADPLHAVNVFSSATSTGGTMRGTIDGNIIGTSGSAQSGAKGNAIRLFIQGKTQGIFKINNNTIRQVWLAGNAPRGMDLQFPGPTAGSQPITVSDITITNNDVDTQAPAVHGPLAAIYLAADNQGSPARVRAQITGNNARNTVGGGSFDYPTFDGNGAHLIFAEVTAGAEGQLVDTGAASGSALSELQTANPATTSTRIYELGITLIPGPINIP